MCSGIYNYLTPNVYHLTCHSEEQSDEELFLISIIYYLQSNTVGGDDPVDTGKPVFCRLAY